MVASPPRDPATHPIIGDLWRVGTGTERVVVAVTQRKVSFTGGAVQERHVTPAEFAGMVKRWAFVGGA